MLAKSNHPKVATAALVFFLHFHRHHLSFHKVVLPSFTVQTSSFQERTVLLDSIALVAIIDKSLTPVQRVISSSKAITSATSLPFRSTLLHQTTFHRLKVSGPFLACVKAIDVIVVLAFHIILGLRSTAI